MLKFYFHHTPNPMKVALFLEESGLEYEVIPVDTFKGEQHTPAFQAINPNEKLPAIDDDGTIVFDSNAILLYLAEKTGRFNGTPATRGELLSWLMFIATGVGPFSGQCVHFTYAHTDSPYAANRYRREVERHYSVLDNHLADREFIVGNEYSIVDIAGWGWFDRATRVLNDDNALDATPNLKRWFQSIDARPAVTQARALSQKITFKTEFDEETKRSLFPQNFPPIASAV
ncbi:MAG: glutathione S-transferase family protein [Cyanobacteria bacterium J06639_14]